MATQKKDPIVDVRFKAIYLHMLALFAAERDVRYYLNGFHVCPATDQKEGGIYLVATDGHAGIVIHDREGTTNGSHILSIPKALLGRCRTPLHRTEKALGGQEARMLRFQSEAVGDCVHASLERPGIGFDSAFRADRIDGTFPQWRKVLVPDLVGATTAGKIIFNAMLFERIGAIGKLLGKAHATRAGYAPVEMFLCKTPKYDEHKSAYQRGFGSEDHAAVAHAVMLSSTARIAITATPMRDDPIKPEEHWTATARQEPQVPTPAEVKALAKKVLKSPAKKPATPAKPARKR